MQTVKEVCVDSLEDAINAEKNGANRIELCSRLDLDGLTPSRELIKETFYALKIPIRVMIRPKHPSFIYSKEENIERALSSVEEGIETAYSNEQLWLKKVVYLHKIGKRKEALELARELLVEDVSVKDTLAASGSDLLKDSEFVKLLSEF